MNLAHVRIVGSGLIGSSIGLALRTHGIEVTMIDSDQRSQAIAQDLMGMVPSTKEVDLVVIATPLSQYEVVIESEYQRNLNSSFIDIGSVKVKAKVEALASIGDLSTFLPSHPMAGREVGGAESARADLFEDRIWVYDSAGVNEKTTQLGLELISLCGATALEMESAAHDQAVALISHLPQAISSLLAAQLQGAPSSTMELAGAGLRDTTRIAASSPALWREILTSNSAALKPLLAQFASDLQVLIEGLDEPEVVHELMAAGNRGRAAIPGKHGGSARSYTYLPVVIEDKPGQLAALFDEAAAASVNVEDLTIEHSPEQFTGLITLALSADDAATLHQHLRDKGWRVHAPR
jgi:prephenate dehydrogenase